MSRNLVSLKAGYGPDFEKWAQAIAKGVIRRVRLARASAGLLDEARDEG